MIKQNSVIERWKIIKYVPKLNLLVEFGGISSRFKHKLRNLFLWQEAAASQRELVAGVVTHPPF